MSKSSERDAIIAHVATVFHTMGGGRATSNNPISMAMKDEPAMFAAGVPVAAVVDAVIALRDRREEPLLAALRKARTYITQTTDTYLLDEINIALGTTEPPPDTRQMRASETVMEPSSGFDYFIASIDTPVFGGGWHQHAIQFHDKDRDVAVHRRDVCLATLRRLNEEDTNAAT